jgi:rhodanese-related sulfurtransferase
MERTALPAAASPPPESYFRAKLRFEIDVMDVAEALPGGGFVLVDSRRRASWEHGRIPGAVHLPTAEIPARALGMIPEGTGVVVYSWGPCGSWASAAA